MQLRAGAALVDITPETPCHLAGYGSRDHEHEGVHDKLSLRALYLTDGTYNGLIVSCDLLGYPLQSVMHLLPSLAQDLGLFPECIMLCATHTHSAPVIKGDKVNAEWLASFEAKTLEAAAAAKAAAREATLSIARTSCAIGENRRQPQPLDAVLAGGDQIRLGINPGGFVDREVILLKIATPDGETIAQVGNFACHGTVLGPSNYQISGDWMGLAASALEHEAGGAPFLFLNGGNGNIDPRVRVQGEFGPVSELAKEFCSAVLKAQAAAQPLGFDGLEGATTLVHLPRKARAVEDGKGKTRPVRLHGIRVGGLRIVGFPGEMFSETSVGVKAGMPQGVTMVTSYNTGYYAGYAPVAEAYEDGGYEVRVSPYAEGAEWILRRSLLELAKRL